MRALLSFASWPVSFEVLVVDLVCLWREVSLPSFVPPCGFGSFERILKCVELTLARVWKVLLNWFNFPS